MRFSVTTVKDTPEHVRRFVGRNLHGGIDHLFVFLDDPADPATPEIRAFLDDHPHVTAVVCDEDWWRGKRPARLNVRQRINANLAKGLLTTVDDAEWIFHIDADEVVRLDPDALARVPASEPNVQLAPLEAVSRESETDDDTWFKTLLDPPELTLLKVLGVIGQAKNGAYFRGHVDGKTGLRPHSELWLTLHRAVDEHDTVPEPHRDPGLTVLHYESASAEEFVRKWTALLAAGPMASFRPAREPTAVALQALLARGLAPDDARPLLMRVYERTSRDDVETLSALRLLVHVDPETPLHTPVPLPERDRARVAAMLGRAAERDKRVFHPGSSPAKVRSAVQAMTGGRRWRRS
jgi:hypothetical protein